MDNLGIDKLIEMIEERFGKAVAHGFLLLIMLAIAAAAIHYIVTLFIVPFSEGLYGLFKLFSGGTMSEARLHRLVFSTLTALLGGTIGLLFIHVVFSAYRAKFSAFFRDWSNSLSARQEKVDAASKAIKALIEQRGAGGVLVRLDDQGDIVPLNQSGGSTDSQQPQGTEPKT